MRLNYFVLVCTFFCSAFLCRSGYADILNLASVGGQSAGGYEIYPYTFGVNGSANFTHANFTQSMYLDFNREVPLGETWQATPMAVPTDISTTSQDYRADAWIFAQLGHLDPITGIRYTAAEVQHADWAIFDPVGIARNAAFDTTASYLTQQAMLAANHSTLMNSGFFSGFKIYTPTTSTAGWTAGMPQRFITEATAVTSEPSSLILLGSGLALGSVFFIRRNAYVSLSGAPETAL